MMREYLISYQN